VPAKKVTPTSGQESSPNCHMPAVKGIHELSFAREDADRHTASDDLPVVGKGRRGFQITPGSPPGWTRKPVTTSSKISATPDSSVILRISFKNRSAASRMTALHRFHEHRRKILYILA